MAVKLGSAISRVTSGGRRIDRNTTGQRGNKFSNLYRDISIVVTENKRWFKAEMLTVYFAN